MHSLLARFLEHLSDVSDQQEERFQQDISGMEVRYRGRWEAIMLADCWSIKSDDAGASHSRKLEKRGCIADDV